MEIIEYNVFGINESLRASGLPMDVDGSNTSPSLNRAKKLGRARVGSGHDCFLKGINVYLEINATLKWFDQFDRYAFQDTISSTSQMHRITKFNFDESFHEYVEDEVLEIVEDRISIYNYDPTPENFERIIYNVPQGFLYTRAITTNYLQLKTIYYQRRNHKLKEWRDFCKFLEELPLFMELIGEVE